MSEQVICIKYRDTKGAVNVWRILRSAVRNDEETTLKAYLAYWHPEYEYLGRETRRTALHQESTQ